MPAGNSAAERIAPIFSAIAGFAASSSTNRVTTGICNFTLSRNGREVTTVLMSHWRMQESKASCERV